MRLASRMITAMALTLAIGACSSSDQPQPVPVPDVVGNNVRDAVEAMDAKGFCVATVWRVEGDESGLVVGQQPGPQNDNVGPGYMIGLEVVATPELREVLSTTTVANCEPEVALAGTVNYAYFYRGSPDA